MKEKFRDKNTIYNIIIKIKNIIFNATNIKSNDILTNLVAEKDKEDINNSTLEKLREKNIDNSFNIKATLDYKFQLTNAYFKYEDELEDINIFYKNGKIRYISINLLIKKILEDNSFNIEIVVNQEINQTFNFLNAFIFQCFGFISYELLINKLLEVHKYYKRHNKLTPKINNRLLRLIFKLTKYLWDHESCRCSYFQSSPELKNNLKKFLNNNSMKDQIKPLLDYKKENLDINNDEDKNDYEISEKSFINYPHGGFEFNILKYNSKDIVLIITYISIKNFKNLFNHLYELNPTIKKKETDKPHLINIINFSIKITNFFIEEVFSYDLLNNRVKIVEKIINILIELRNIRNYNDLFAVYVALLSISMRLPKTWNQIDSKLKTKLKEFNKLCSNQGCYKNIREEQSKCFKEKKFYIPFINITTKHINFYDEGLKYTDKNGLVCIEKIIVNQNEIEQFKNELRPLRRKNKLKLIKNTEELNELKINFYNLNPKDLDTLENISQKLEPEFTLYKAPDSRKRKTKTDLFINSNKFLNVVK